MIDDERATQDILAYLREHPCAGDTMEGISKWWFLRQRVSKSVDVVRLVLDELRRQGLVQARKMADGQTVYFADTKDGSCRLVEDETDDKNS